VPGVVEDYRGHAYLEQRLHGVTHELRVVVGIAFLEFEVREKHAL